MKNRAEEWFKELRGRLISMIENHDQGKFQKKKWKHSGKGGGLMSIIKGDLIEKGGVNISTVSGKFSEEMQQRIPGADKDPSYWATGISVVLHPQNPNIPSMHFNTRYLSTTQTWFGGGMDVTPAIKDEKEKKNFHKILKAMCDRHNKNYYKKYKKWCDEYFYLPHRKEARGIGGIFFDYKNDNFENDFKFVRDVGVTFQMLFNEIIKKKLKRKWTLKDKEFQYIKRGRYAEFNLLYDRGTKFGLQTGGNVEGILMSLPPIAKWK